MLNVRLVFYLELSGVLLLSTCSKSTISLKASFAPTAEAKKAGKAGRRVEETPKLALAVGRTDCKN